MANYYWVGGTGNWSDYANHWATSSGGSTFYTNAPTSADNVFFNNNSAAIAYTVTIDTASAACANFDASGITNASFNMTLTGTASVGVLTVNGNWTNPTSTYFAWTTWTNSAIVFTTTGTIITNNVSFAPNIQINGSGVTVTLGGAFTSPSSVSVIQGTFDTSATNNYSFSTGVLQINANSNIKQVNLNASSVTLTSITPYTDISTGGFTLNAGTSTITCSSASNATFAGGGKTFWNVLFTGTGLATITISGANTFNNLSFATPATVRVISISANQTINGTLTLSSSSSYITRNLIVSTTPGTQITLTLNGASSAVAGFNYIDLRDMKFATSGGSTVTLPLTGTSIGDCGGNDSGSITATVAKTVYYSLAAGGNWNSTAWATSSGGTPAAANFPLVQDNVIIDNNSVSSGSTITINSVWSIGNLSASGRTLPLTIAGAYGPYYHGSVTWSSAVTYTSTAISNLYYSYGRTNTLTSANLFASSTLTSFSLWSPYSGTLRLADNLTLPSGCTVTFNSGNLDLATNNVSITAGLFSSNNSNTRSIAFGTGNITCTGVSASGSTAIWSCATLTGFSYTGMPNVYWTGNGTANTRQVNHGNTAGGTAANAVSFIVTAGSDTILISAPYVVNVDFSNGGAGTFTGTYTAPSNNFSGNLILKSGMSLTSASAVLIFGATSGTQQLTTAGLTLNFPIFQNNLGATLQLQDDLTMGSTRTFTLTSGTFNANNKNVSVGTFSSNNSNSRTITMGSGTWTLNSTTGTVWNTSTTSNLTLNANTSTVICTDANPTFNGGGLTYNNLTFNSTTAGTINISGTNTYNNFTVTARSTPSVTRLSFNNNNAQIITGTFSVNSGAASLDIRTKIDSPSLPNVTISAATVSLTNCDFSGITGAGTAAPFTGTSLGDGTGNSNIIFASPKTVYWSLTSGGNWNSTAWATSSGGTPSAANFPLPQDTIYIDNTGLTTGNTITFNSTWYVGNLISTRTTAWNFYFTSIYGPTCVGNVTLDANANVTTATYGMTFILYGSSSATFTSNGATISVPITVFANSGALAINGNLTLGSTKLFTLTSGTLDLTNGGTGNYTLSTGLFYSNTTNTRSIAFGTGSITLTGNATTVWSFSTITNFSYTGTPTVNLTYSGATGTRTVVITGSGATASNTVNMNISAGSDVISVLVGCYFLNLNFTGFTGNLRHVGLGIYGNLTYSSGMTLGPISGTTSFVASSGTQQITSAGQTLNFPVTQNNSGATLQLQDDLTLGSTQTFTLTSGNLDLNGKTATVGTFSATGASTGAITFNRGKITVTGSSFAAPSSNLTISAGTGNGTISMTSSSAKTFTGGGLVWPATLDQGGTGGLAITGGNTFADMTASGTQTGPSTIIFPSGNTTTFTNAFSLTGTATSYITLLPSMSGSPYTLSLASGTVNSNFLNITSSITTGGATWYAGGNSINSVATSVATITQAWATLAGSAWPYGIAIDGSGNLYTANFSDGTVSKITPSGTVTQAWATLASGTNPNGIAIDSSGNVYISNQYGNSVSKITSAGVVTQAWATWASGAYPNAIAIDSSGNVYTSNNNSTVSKITPSGVLTYPWATLASGAYPNAIAIDSSGNVYTANFLNSTVSKITPSGTVTQAWATLSGSGANPTRIAIDSSGNVYTSNNNNTVSKITPSGTVTQAWATLASGTNPTGIAIDSSGNVYTANEGNSTVSKIVNSSVVPGQGGNTGWTFGWVPSIGNGITFGPGIQFT